MNQNMNFPDGKTQFSWVNFDPSVPEMFCKVCREYPNKADESGSFLMELQLLENRKHCACEKAAKCVWVTHIHTMDEQ